MQQLMVAVGFRPVGKRTGPTTMQTLMVVVGLVVAAALLVLCGLFFLREDRQTASPADRDICKEQGFRRGDTSAAAFNRCLARRGVGDVDDVNLPLGIWLFVGSAAALVFAVALVVESRRGRREIEEQRREVSSGPSRSLKNSGGR